MKKLLLCSMLLITVFFSCKKDHNNNTNPVSKTYGVKFNVSGFTQLPNSVTQPKQVNSLKTQDVNLPAGYFTMLYYYVFDTKGNIVHSLTQDSTATNFGSIADQLPAGTYQVSIAMGKGGLITGIDRNNTNPYKETFLAYSATLNNSIWKDTFLKDFQLTVTGSDVDEAVVLNRIVGDLQIKILDAIPAAASSLSVTVSQEFLYYNISTGQTSEAYSHVFSILIPAADIGKTNFTYNNVLVNTTSLFKVTVTCYDASKKILGTAVIDSVSCQPNKTTILSGDLFGSANTFNISLGTWDPTPIITPFSIYDTTRRVNAIRIKKGL